MKYDFSILDMLHLLDNFSSSTQMNYMPPMGKDLEVAIAYCLKSTLDIDINSFSRFYGKLGVKSWLLFHLIRKITFYSEILTQILNCGFFHSFHLFKKTTVPHNNFFSQTFSVENNKIQRMILKLGITYQRVDYS